MELVDLKDIKRVEIVPGYHAKIVESDSMTCVYWEIYAGYTMERHSHESEQICNVIEGDFELTVNGDTKVLSAGMMAIIPPNAQHFGRSLTDCRVMDTFHPVREDYSEFSQRQK